VVTPKASMSSMSSLLKFQFITFHVLYAFMCSITQLTHAVMADLSCAERQILTIISDKKG